MSGGELELGKHIGRFDFVCGILIMQIELALTNPCPRLDMFLNLLKANVSTPDDSKIS